MTAVRVNSPTTPIPQLTPQDKALSIGVTNVGILLFTFIANTRGIHVDGNKTGLALWVAYRAFILAAAACLVPVIAGPLIETAAKLGSGSEEPVTKPPAARILDRHLSSPVTSMPALVYLVGITLLTYLAITVLVLNSGGAIASPFNQFPIAIIVLAPIIMTGRKTPIFNLGLGTVYAIALFYAKELRVLDRHVVDLPEGAHIATWVYASEVVLVIIVSLGFYLVRDRKRRSA